MYFQAIQQFIFSLENLEKIIEKAQCFAESRKFDPNLFCDCKLAPDMFTFTRQIQIACDVAKSVAASLTDKKAPTHENGEKSLDELKIRIKKCTNFLKECQKEECNGVNANSVIPMSYPQGKAMYAEEFLWSRALPNFFFHITTAYNLLRAGGVEIGKADFLGNINQFDL